MKTMVIIIKQEKKDGGLSTSREVIGDDLSKVERDHVIEEIKRLNYLS